MPGTTRYSATFDRTYEEDDRLGPPPPANARRSRSQSLQTLTGLDGRPYTPLGPRPPAQRSSSTDSGAKGPDFIPTRTVAKTTVKAHNNPFQFVKVGSCPLYKKAEEQLQKTKEVKKQDVFREEEEEWQSNLDSWKSRRRKMSEDVFRRQEEIKQFELEEQFAQVSQKKTKTFSEMVESRAHRGRALSLCLISNPLEFQDWEFENKSNTNGSCSTFTDESEENSNVNSEDEGFSLRGRSGRPAHHDNQKNIRTNGDAHIEQNGSKLETQNGDFNNVQIKPKEGSYIDSGLESISSSHRAGDTPDSGSDFSQDSNSSIDCESPRTGVNILEEFSSKTLQMSGEEISVKLSLSDKTQGFGFQFQGGKDAGQVLITSVAKECSGVQIGDQIMRIEGSDVSSKTHAEIISLVQKGQEKGEISLILWRHTKTTNGFNTEEKCVESPLKPNTKDNQDSKSESQQYEKSIESENEMYVDDFEELQRQSELLTSSKASETTCTNSQAQSGGKISTVLSSDKDSVKSAPVPKIVEHVSNGAVDKENTNEKTDSEISTESPKKNIVKVKRVRRKGVYALDVSGTPNSIPQEGIPVGALYPLSPVTELPSPADETKTISSTLSSKPTTPVSNSQSSILPKETEAKVNSSAIKENNKTTVSAPKSVISKTTAPSDESKINVSEKVESKIDSSNVPSSPTVTKNKEISLESSVEEKPKLPSSPKKVKVKVKKANAPSEQKPSESSLSIKETSVSQISDLSVKKLTSESQPKKEQKSDSVTDDKSVNVNKNENVKPSSKMENNVSSTETATTKSDAISSSSNDKTSCIKAETSPKNPRNLSLKINTPNESANLAATPPVISAKTPKTPVDEKSKPPLVPKKDKVKPKESSAGSTPVTSEEKSVSLKDKSTVIVNNASVEKTKNISVKTDTKDESLHITTSSPVTSSKLPKTPQEEKAKPSLTQTKEKTKSKEVNTLPFESAVNTKEVKPIELTDKSPVTSAGKNRKVALDNDTQTQATSLPSTPPVQDIKMPKSPQDEKPKASLAQKKDKIPKENNSLAVESDINMKEAKSTELKDKSLDTSDKNKKPTSVDAQNQATNLTSTNSIQDVKMPKTPQEEKPKSTVAQKKEKLPKENTTLPVESAMSTKEVKSVELKDKIPVTSVDKNKKPTIENDTKNQPTNSALTPSAQDAKKPKTPQDEKPKAPLAQKKDKVLKENNSPITETSVNVQDVKSSSLKEKTAVTTNESSPNKTRDLSLNIQVQDPAANLATSPVPSNAKQPKTPQSDKSKPSFVQKKGKSKAKTPDKSPDSSQETKETFIISITTTSSPAVNFTQENPLIKELNSLSAETKENSSCSEGNTTVIQETKGIDSMNTTSACSSVAPSTKTKKLSLNIQAAQNQSINEATPPVVTAKPPKTPQDEKSKLSFSQKKGKSKAKGKMADLPTTPPTQTSTTSQSLPSSPKTVVAESDQKVQKSGSLTDVTSIKVLNENNKLLPRTPTIPSEIKSTDSKEKLNSDKTKNLSLQVDTQKESVASDAVSSDRNTKEPKTPQEEKTKPRLVRRKSKSKGKAAECMSPASPVSEKESSNNLSCKPAETVKPKSDSHTKQNSSSIANDVQVSVSNERAKSSETRVNNTLSSGTSTETKTFSSEKSISSDENKKFSLDDAQKVSVPLEATPSVANNKQPKTPQDEKTKPRLVRKRSKSKGKITEPTSPGSTVSDKGTAGNSLPHTTGESSATRNEPHEQNLGLVTNDVPGALLNESTESSNAREKNSLLNGTPTALPEPNETKEKSAAAKNTKNLSLKIEAQNDSVALDTAPVAGNNTKPKTPQGDKAKPRLARKRSKSKGKNTEQLSGHPSQVDKNSLDNSASQTSATETLASSKEPQKEQKLVSVADDKPIKMVNEKAESSDKREKNDLSSVTPTTLPKATSISLKENLGITSSDKTENLSLNINLNEPATTDKKPAVAKSKQPRTPQDEKPKPHFIRRRERSKSRDKFLERYPSCDSFDVPKEEASSSPSLVIPNEKSTNKMQPKKKQNGASDVAVNKLNNTESSQTMDNSSCAETADVKSTASKDKMSVGNIAMDSDKTRNLTEKCKQPTNTTVIHPVVNTYPSQTDEKSKASLVQNKEITKPKVNSPSSKHGCQLM